MDLLPIVESEIHQKPVKGADRFSKGRYAFVSLGCPKNLVDSEKMLGTLALDGYALVSRPEDADFVIVNTCGFIESSRQESKSVIEEMLELKRQGKTRGVIVAGCLPECTSSGQVGSWAQSALPQCLQKCRRAELGSPSSRRAR